MVIQNKRTIRCPQSKNKKQSSAKPKGPEKQSSSKPNGSDSRSSAKPDDQKSLLIFDSDEEAKPIITKPKVVTQTKKSKSEAKQESAHKVGGDIFQQSIELIYQCDPEQNSSKEDLIERLEYKLSCLSPESSDIATIEHVLQHLKEEFRAERISTMTQTREKQDYIVKRNQLKPEHFKGKTDMTPDSYKEFGEDEQLKIMVASKKFFEKIRDYQKPPKTVINPFSKGNNRGNRKAPSDILMAIENKFSSENY